MALPKSWTTVTTLSKTIALILFIALPFLGFYFGMQYQKNGSVSLSLESGIYGKATIGPTCPVQKDNQDCTKPYQGEFQIMRSTPNSDEIIGKFSTDSNGNFKVSLPPGHYTILHTENIPPS